MPGDFDISTNFYYYKWHRRVHREQKGVSSRDIGFWKHLRADFSFRQQVQADNLSKMIIVDGCYTQVTRDCRAAVKDRNNNNHRPVNLLPSPAICHHNVRCYPSAIPMFVSCNEVRANNLSPVDGLAVSLPAKIDSFYDTFVIARLA